jgi:hypothetical protein
MGGRGCDNQTTRQLYLEALILTLCYLCLKHQIFILEKQKRLLTIIAEKVFWGLDAVEPGEFLT